MGKALVSVVMPVYNAEKYIAEAVESILNQTYPEFELVLVDDCGNDKSMKIVDRYRDERIRVLHNDVNRGIAYSRNRAIEESRGEYIAIMDDDDISSLQRFEKQVGFLEKHPEIDVLGGAVEAIDGDGRVIRRASEVLNNPLYIKVNFLFHCIFHNSEVMFRKSMLENSDIRYCENCYGMEDFRFWIECSKVGKMTNLPDIILQHRYHEKTETARVKREKYEERRSFYRELQRLSFGLSGFELSEEEYDILTGSFPEGSMTELSLQEIRNLFAVVEKILFQSKSKEMDFKRELAIYLKKQLLYAIDKCKDL